MDNDNKYIRLVTRLIKDTIKGDLNWQTIGSNTINLARDGQIVDQAYVCTFNERRFRVYKYKFEAYVGDFDKFYWTVEATLEMINNQNETVWEFPNHNAVYDLYNTVRQKVSGIDDFIEDLFSDNE